MEREAKLREEVQDPIFWTVPEAANALRLDPSYAYKLVQAGQIPGVFRFGKAIRIHVETLRQWAREQVNRKEGPIALVD